MARGTSDQTKKIFIHMIGGKFAETVDATHPKAVKRFSEKKNCDVYEAIDDFISGRITELKLNKGNFGWELIMLVKDMDETYQIQIPTNSQHFTSFANKLPNINLNQDVALYPYSFDDKVKKKANGEPRRIVGMNVVQGSEKILNTYSKENPIPELTFPKNGDEEDIKMYYMQEEKFYRSLVQRYAGKFTTESDVEEEMESAQPTTYGTYQNNPPIVDDLPF